jgi:hypothetical protein
MESFATDLDTETLRRCGEVSVERATTLPPVAAALLAACVRLASVDLATSRGRGPDGGQGG